MPLKQRGRKRGVVKPKKIMGKVEESETTEESEKRI